MIKVITLWRQSAEDFMDCLREDYGYEIEKTVSHHGVCLEWKIKFDVNEKRDDVMDWLEKCLNTYWWFLNIE